MCVSVHQLRYAGYPQFNLNLQSGDKEEADRVEDINNGLIPLGGVNHGNRETIDYEEEDFYERNSYC